MGLLDKSNVDIKLVLFSIHLSDVVYPFFMNIIIKKDKTNLGLRVGTLGESSGQKFAALVINRATSEAQCEFITGVVISNGEAVNRIHCSVIKI